MQTALADSNLLYANCGKYKNAMNIPRDI